MIKRGRGLIVGAVASVALALGGPGAVPAAAAEQDEAPPADLVRAVEADLGMTWEDFVRAGAQVEEASATIDEAGPGQVPVLTAQGVGLADTRTLGDTGEGVSPFTDLDAVREAYLRDVGPEGLTGVVVTLDGYEVLVAGPHEATERGRLAPEGEPVSPAEWGRRHGVSVTASSGAPEPAATLRGGAPVSFGGVSCSHGFNGWYRGQTRGIAAGHCVTMGGTRVSSSNGAYLGTVDWHQFGAPGSAWESWGTDLTTYTITSGTSTPPEIATATGALTITGRANAVLGMPTCKQGRVTGWTCSRVTKIGWQWIGDGSGDISKPKRWVWSLFADTRIIPGDSGGPWVSGRKAVGVSSSLDWHSDGRPYATASLLTSFDDYRPGAQVKVWLGRVVLDDATYSDDRTARARWDHGSTVSGRLTKFSGDSVSAGTVVEVRIDGALSASPAVAADGTFSFTYDGSDSTSHTVTLRARSGDSLGPTVTVGDQPAGVVPKPYRYSGDDRYGTAARIATSMWPNGASTVYVASGQAFPDALSGGAIAGRDGAPVLLVKAGSIPATTRSAITALAPERIVVIGGTRAVSAGVERELDALAGSVERVGGQDRYEVAAAIAGSYHDPRTVYVTSGEAFPDALSIAPRAGRAGSPLLLTKKAKLSSASAAELERLAPSRIVLVGGTEAVSGHVENQLRSYAPSVTRVDGENRYAVSARIARLTSSPAPAVWLARGDDFADALAAAPAAAKAGVPVLLTRPDALSRPVRSAMNHLEPPRVNIAGGYESVSRALQDSIPWMTFR